MNKLDNLLQNTRDLALKRRAKWIVENLSIESGDKVLDAGCGDGYYLFLLANFSNKVTLTGTDYDALGLKSAKLKLKIKKIKLIQGDLTKKLPFKSNSFNKIVLSEVLEHLPNDIKGLNEIFRILKPGGTLCLSVPNANYPFLWDPINWLLERLLGKHIKSGFFAGIWNQHQRLYTNSKLVNALSRAGFKILEVKALTFWCLPFNHHLINIGARILVTNQNSEFFKEANKFSLVKSRKSSILHFIFFVMSLFDGLNEVWQPKTLGVSLVAVVRKEK